MPRCEVRLGVESEGEGGDATVGVVDVDAVAEDAVDATSVQPSELVSCEKSGIK